MVDYMGKNKDVGVAQGLILYPQTNKEKRRYFDCLCELNYVKLLLGKITFSKFEKAQYNLAIDIILLLAIRLI